MPRSYVPTSKNVCRFLDGYKASAAWGAEQATGLWIPQSTSPKRIYGRHSADASAQLSEWPKPLIQGTSMRVSQLSGHHNQVL